MSSDSVEDLYQRCRRDPDFRTKVRRDKRTPVEEAGFDLTEAEWDVFDAIDWDLADEVLLERYAKPMRVT